MAWAGGGRRGGARTRGRHKNGGGGDEGNEGVGGGNRRKAVMLAVFEVTLYFLPHSSLPPSTRSLRIELPASGTSHCSPS